MLATAERADSRTIGTPATLGFKDSATRGFKDSKALGFNESTAAILAAAAAEHSAAAAMQAAEEARRLADASRGKLAKGTLPNVFSAVCAAIAIAALALSVMNFVRASDHSTVVRMDSSRTAQASTVHG